jgi:hypothetical protein
MSPTFMRVVPQTGRSAESWSKGLTIEEGWEPHPQHPRPGQRVVQLILFLILRLIVRGLFDTRIAFVRRLAKSDLAEETCNAGVALG